MPADHAAWLAQLKLAIHGAQTQALLTVNATQIRSLRSSGLTNVFSKQLPLVSI